MIIFWIAAALLSAAAVALIVHFAGREPQAARQDPSAAFYRRQLEEIDELANRGLLGVEERKAAHAEAARRLLSAGELSAETGPSRQTRLAVIAAGLGTVVVAMGVYQIIGAPGAADQPFAKRAARWMAAAQSDPSSLTAEQLSVVMGDVVASNPDQAEPLFFLARTQVQSGQVQLGIHNLRKAAALAPDNADIWATLGEALMVAAKDDAGTPEALAALAKAVELNPQNSVRPRYFLARAKIAAGDVQTGLGEWRQLLETLPPNDAAATAIQAEIAQVEKTGALGAAEEENSQTQMIAQMVEGLAARLKENPDDADGWARLVRSYAVLGDTQKMNEALAEARRIFKDRPSERAAIEAAVERPQ